ncbi:MAG: hypothetical protein GY737_20995 [Desulfobacteraceae bacterium]|nr:hypothetical protein [Desulfobacteraceae bacterium]
MRRIFLTLCMLFFTQFASSAWAALTQTEVSQLYVSLLGRASEGDGNAYWMNSTNMDEAAGSMLNCTDVKNYFGTALDSNQAFIEHIYFNTLGKTYADDKTGIDYWVGELNRGVSKSSTITSLINAAIEPVNAGAAQDQFNNRVEVSNYCADVIAPCTDPHGFTGFIANVTDDDATIASAMELIDTALQKLSFTANFGGTDDDYGNSVQQTEGGGYIITGWTESYGSSESDRDVYLIKTDGIGKKIWSATFGGSDSDYGNSVRQTTDGGYIVAGTTESFVSQGSQVYLIKIDSSGNTIWTKTFGSKYFNSGKYVQQTADGGYIIAGSTSLYDNTSDFYLIKTDGSGNETWSKTYGGTDNYEALSVEQTKDGGYIIAGPKGYYKEGYLVKTDGSGNETWSKTFGDKACYSVHQTTDGGYIIGANELGGTDSSLIKTDSSGNETWSATFDGIKFENGDSVQQTTDGGYIIAGWTSGSELPPGSTVWISDVNLIKTDGSGNEIWSSTFGGKWSDSAHSVQQTADGGYVIAGNTDSYGGGADTNVYLIKTDGNGKLINE